MSYNPTRAKNFYKNPSRRRRLAPNPHAGTKHSDIVRRNGMGATVPLENRQQTASGFMASVFENDKFSVRQEVLAAGSSIGWGCNKKADRVIKVLTGVLYITVEEGGEKAMKTVQAGGYFRAPRKTQYGYATSGTADAEILVIESADYHKTWESLEDSIAPSGQPQIFVQPAASSTNRPARRSKEDRTQAVSQALRTASKGRRRKPQRMAVQAAQSGAGDARIGKNTTTNTNSGNVAGVNPMPGGAAAFRD